MGKKGFLLILIFFFLSKTSFFSQSKQLLPSTLEEAESPVSLFDYQINDSHIEFFANGSWESTALGGFTLSKESDEPVAFSFNPFAFTQTVDLSVWFLLNNKWYFEAAFQDGFEKNTVAAGYYGTDTLKHLRIGNRGIVFGDKYPITNIGGGTNQAPGVMAFFSQDNWDATMLFRYDMKQNMSATFMGDNELTENTISFTEWEKGKVFVLPQNTIEQISCVYVESSSGSYKDSLGRSYRKLSSSEYLLIFSTNTLVLAEKAEGCVLVDYTDESVIRSSLGTFGTATEIGQGFLGELQSYFIQDNNRAFNLVEYSWGKQDSSGFFTLVDNSIPVLMIQNPPFFSPFVSCNYYNLYTKKVDSVSIISESTGESSSDFEVVVSDEFQSLTSKDFLATTYDYAEVFNIKEDSIVSNMFPLANVLPEVYLLSVEDAKTVIQYFSDYCINVITANPVTSYVIGTEAIPGTIIVYRDGIRDEGFSFDSKTGIVTFANKPTSVERVNISWQEESSDATTGSIVAAMGFSYNPFEVFTFSGAIAFQWAVSNGVAYTTEEDTSLGFLSAAISAEYKDFGFDIKDTITASLEASDTTGVFRLDSMSNKYSSEIALSSTSGVELPPVIVPSLNDRGQEIYPSLFSNERIENSSFVEVRDASVDGYVIKASWLATNPSEVDSMWTAHSIDFVSAAELQSAKRFSIKMKLSSFKSSFDVYLQLGVNADSSLTYENIYSIPTWKISTDNELLLFQDVKSGFVVNPTMIDEWQTIEVELSDIDRSRLSKYQDARIIIVQHSDKSEISAGENVLFIGPYNYSGSTYSAISNDIGVKGITYQILDTDLLDNEFVKSANTDSDNKTQNTVQYFGFEKMTGSKWQEDIEFIHYVNSVHLSSYKELSFYVYIPTIVESQVLPSFRFLLDSASTQSGVSLMIDSSALELYRGEWKQVKVDLTLGQVYLDDFILPNNSYTCTISKDAYVSRIKVNLISPDTEDMAENSGYYLFDEVLLTGIIPEFSAKNEASINYKKEGAILKVKDFPILQDFNLSAESTQKISSLNDLPVFSGLVKAESVIAGVKTSFTAIHDLESEQVISNANHMISSTGIIPVLGFSESYFYSPQSKIYRKNTSVSLTSPFAKFPLVLSLASNANNEYASQSQDWNAKANVSINGKKLSYVFSFTGLMDQLNKSSTFVDGYGESWYNGSLLQLSEGLESAYKRQVKMELMQQLKFPFAQFSPSFTVSIDNMYKNTSSSTNKSSSILTFKCPFNINSNVFSFNIIRLGTKDGSVPTGGSYISDIESYVSSLSTQSFLLTSIPFYELFDTNLMNNINSMNIESDVLSYNSTYEVSWKRPLIKSYLDYFVPSSLNLALAKDIVNSGNSNSTDIFQFKTTMGFIGLNGFGSLSINPIFSFFEQDEVVSSYSCTLKFDAQDRVLTDYLYSGFTKLSMFFTKDNVLRNTAEFQVTSTNWKIKDSISWKRPGKAVFLVKMAAYLFRDITKESFSLYRTNTLSYANTYLTSISTNAKYTNSIEFIHTLELKAGEYLSIKTEANALCSITETLTTFTGTLSLIGNVSF